MVVDPKYSPLISIVPLPEQAPELQQQKPDPLPEETNVSVTPDALSELPQDVTDAPAPDAEESLPQEIDMDTASDIEKPEDSDAASDSDVNSATEESSLPPPSPVPAAPAEKARTRKRVSERKILRKNRILFLLVSTLLLLVVLYSPHIFSTLYENTVTLLTQVGILEEKVEVPYTPVVLTDEILSEQAILIDLQTGRILAEKDAERAIPPASMTKIMTLMTAVEQVADLDDTFTMTQTILNTTYDNDLSIAGFMHDETVPVRDLLYGLILPSGADAAFGLSSYLAALDIPESEQSFSEIMNEKAAQYGLSSVHFSNSTGMFEETHQASLHDVAVMLWFAMQDDICREVLTTVNYTTTKTEQHPDGIELTNMFLVKIAEEDCGAVTVIAAKTGFVDESGRCAASYAVDESGHAYICVTAKTESYEEVIADHALLYATFIPAISDADDAAA